MINIDRYREYFDKGEKAPQKPWWKRIFAPYEETNGRKLMRCFQCTTLMWSNGEEIKKHGGHKVVLAIGGSFWEFLRVKLGWIR